MERVLGKENLLFDVPGLHGPVGGLGRIVTGQPPCSVQDYRDLAADASVYHWRTHAHSGLQHFAAVVEPTYEATLRLHEPGRTLLFAPGNSHSGFWLAHEKLGMPIVGGCVSPTRVPSRSDPAYPPRPLPGWVSQLARSRHVLRALYALQGRRAQMWGGAAPSAQFESSRPRAGARRRGSSRSSAGGDAARAPGSVCRPPDPRCGPSKWCACGRTGSERGRRTGPPRRKRRACP